MFEFTHVLLATAFRRNVTRNLAGSMVVLSFASCRDETSIPGQSLSSTPAKVVAATPTVPPIAIVADLNAIASAEPASPKIEKLPEPTSDKSPSVLPNSDLAKIIGQLKSDDPIQQKVATEKISTYGHDALPYLIAACTDFQDGHVLVNEVVGNALAYLLYDIEVNDGKETQKANEGAVKTIVYMLDSKSPAEQAGACCAWASMRPLNLLEFEKVRLLAQDSNNPWVSQAASLNLMSLAKSYNDRIFSLIETFSSAAERNGTLAAIMLPSTEKEIASEIDRLQATGLGIERVDWWAGFLQRDVRRLREAAEDNPMFANPFQIQIKLDESVLKHISSTRNRSR